MNAIQTRAIVLGRTNFGEADRIVTFLTDDNGKIRVMAKGVRKEKSKLAGGIELFSISDIGFIKGRGDLGTLTSSRLKNHYSNFVGDLPRLEFAYACLKNINKITETVDDVSFFKLTEHLFIGLDDLKNSLPILQVWWYVQIAEATGHGVNVEQLADGAAFTNADATFLFDAEKEAFVVSPHGTFKANHIKFLRLAKGHTPALLANVTGGDRLAGDLELLMKSFVESRA